jgi:hypothetical protein
MKRYSFKLILVLIASAGLALSSCKKPGTAIDDSISAADANNVTNVMHSTSDDAASAAGQVSSYKSLSSGSIALNNSNGNLLVGATITDTSSTGIVITYDAVTPCNGIVRSGTITVTNTGGIPWHLQNAELTVTYNLTATDQITGYTYTLTGSHTILNETGGLAWQVAAGLAAGPVTHRIQSSNMKITFPNNTQRTWTVDRTRSWSYANSVVTVSVYSENTGGVSESGTNRFGDAFSNTFVTTVTGNSTCLFRPYTGTWQHKVSTRTATVVFGTNALGTPVGTPSYCGAFGLYGFYITYTNGSRTLYKFISYWR